MLWSCPTHKVAFRSNQGAVGHCNFHHSSDRSGLVRVDSVPAGYTVSGSDKPPLASLKGLPVDPIYASGAVPQAEPDRPALGAVADIVEDVACHLGLSQEIVAALSYSSAFYDLTTPEHLWSFLGHESRLPMSEKQRLYRLLARRLCGSDAPPIPSSLPGASPSFYPSSGDPITNALLTRALDSHQGDNGMGALISALNSSNDRVFQMLGERLERQPQSDTSWIPLVLALLEKKQEPQPREDSSVVTLLLTHLLEQQKAPPPPSKADILYEKLLDRFLSDQGKTVIQVGDQTMSPDDYEKFQRGEASKNIGSALVQTLPDLVKSGWAAAKNVENQVPVPQASLQPAHNGQHFPGAHQPSPTVDTLITINCPACQQPMAGERSWDAWECPSCGATVTSDGLLVQRPVAAPEHQSNGQRPEHPMPHLPAGEAVQYTVRSNEDDADAIDIPDDSEQDTNQGIIP